MALIQWNISVSSNDLILISSLIQYNTVVLYVFAPYTFSSLSICYNSPTVVCGYSTVSHVNAHPQSLGPKLLLRFTRFFGCYFMCILLSPSGDYVWRLWA